MSFAMDDYVDVAGRIKRVKEMYPEAVFRPANPLEPFKIIEVAGITYIAYTAALYRDPFDPCPAIACAWEEVPGRTPYTKGSELMNAETSAWGRCAIAIGIPSKKIASLQEVKARQEAPKATVTAIKKPEQQDVDDPWAADMRALDVIEAAAFNVYNCMHGERMEVSGEKNGKAYYGMGCRKDRNSGEQCNVNWFVLNAEGTWVPKIAAVK